jgi:hypothetical protein
MLPLTIWRPGLQDNRMECVKLAERWANLLNTVLDEYSRSKDEIKDLMREPLEKLTMSVQMHFTSSPLYLLFTGLSWRSRTRSEGLAKRRF